MFVTLALFAMAQQSPPGAEAGFFGQGVVAVDDLDGDGVRDFAVGAPRYGSTFPGPSGCVFVYSGASGKEISSWQPTPGARSKGEGHGFGGVLVPGGDLDGDGVGDVLIGAQGPVGTFAWSAKLGRRLFALDVDPSHVHPLGDLDRDGCDDLLVARQATWIVISGRGGGTLATVAEPPSKGLWLLNDGNGDGLADGVSADGKLLLISERRDDGTLRFRSSPSGLSEGRRHPERVEVARGPEGARQLLTVDARGPRIRMHRIGNEGLERFAELDLEGEALDEKIAKLQAVAVPHGGSHDLIVALKLRKNPFEIYVRRHRPGQAAPVWVRRLFYPSCARIVLTSTDGPGGAARLIAALAETGWYGTFHGHGAAHVVNSADGEVIHGINESSTRLSTRFDAMTRWSKRLLVIEGDPATCAQQLAALPDDEGGIRERKLVVVELRGSVVIEHIGTLGLQVPAEFLRRRARLDRLPFQAVLLGLDGDDKHRAFAPIPTAELFGMIDRMPMRRKELEGK